MNKILTHFKNNAIFYLIILLCLVILGIAIFVKGQEKVETLDTKLFNIVSLKEANNLFEDDSPKYLLISTNTCSATIGFAPTLKIAAAKAGISIYYLELNDIDKENKEDLEDFYKFQKKLDYPYNLRGEVKPVGDFIGKTPMSIIIKNKKVVYAYIGSMSEDALTAIISRYM